MKKLVSTFLSLFCVIGVACAFVGCGDDDGEVDAWVCTLDTAYERGYLDEDDLKSIACRQYECYEMEENPYSGMFTQQAEISAKAEKDFKKVFCDKYEIEEPSDLEIIYYYGTYEGNVVVEANYSGMAFKKHIGGVVFTNDDFRPIRVLHYTEYRSDSATVTGRLYDIETAYENGWLGEDDLKSLACYRYGVNSEDNPYSGMYKNPEDKLSREMRSELKDAYLRQIAQTWSTCLDDASVYRYYGTYNGNIVVAMAWEAGCIYPIISDKEIGGVVFKNYNPLAFYVYHFFEK